MKYIITESQYNLILESQKDEVMETTKKFIDTAFPQKMRQPIWGAFQKSVEEQNFNTVLRVFPEMAVSKFNRVKSILDSKLKKLKGGGQEYIQVGIETANSIGEKCEKPELTEQLQIWGIGIPFWKKCFNIVINLFIIYCFYYAAVYAMNNPR